MAEFEVSPALAQVLLSRGFARAHLTPELSLSPNPALHEAARRLVAAMRAKKRVRIHGDYDADGVTATAVLVMGLRELGANVHGFIPHRLNEGYGVHPDKVEEHALACDLLLTVDCGVTNLAEVRALLDKGVEVIVTDHHSPGPDFPPCLVVHPKLTPNYDHDLHNLTGAGVAYHLLWAVHEALQLPPPLKYADIATIGIVADVAPLVGENRALVTAGLARFRTSEHPGIRALMGSQKLERVTARDVAFILAPRINAAGRLGEADLALELLTTPSKQRAAELAVYLDQRNKDRRVIQDRMFKEALDIVEPSDPAIVVTHESWHAGIMGIVASKLLETFYKPVFIIAQGKGSVRSTPGISAVDGLRAAADLLKRFGGHTGAAGFALYDENIPKLRERLHDFARRFPPPERVHHLDAALPTGAAVMSLLSEIDAFEPYGEGHRPPLWWLRTELQDSRLVGKNGDSLQFKVGRDKGILHGTAKLPRGTQDLAATLRRDTYNGRERLEFAGVAVRPANRVELEGASDGPRLPRLEPKDAMGRVRGGTLAYADGSVADYLQTNVPGVRFVQPGERVRQEIVLFGLPSEDDLRAWLREGHVTFAWGPKTLEALRGRYGYHREGLALDADADVLAELGVRSAIELRGAELWRSARWREDAADAYRRWLWAHLYEGLDDAGWSSAVLALTGVRAGEHDETLGVLAPGD
ncbi:single-stranded-DNA-specific exonuclease RecJ [Deinococcus yavapaiensis]|nr:single-stranded-DNA-specific exonuclease RecJ [Deinococcus yavapaiensis]